MPPKEGGALLLSKFMTVIFPEMPPEGCEGLARVTVTSSNFLLYPSLSFGTLKSRSESSRLGCRERGGMAACQHPDQDGGGVKKISSKSQHVLQL